VNIHEAIEKALSTSTERPKIDKSSRRTYPAVKPLTGRTAKRARGLCGAFVQGAAYRRVRSLRSLGLMPGSVSGDSDA